MSNRAAFAKTYVMAACAMAIALLTMCAGVKSSWAGSAQSSVKNFTPVSTGVVFCSATISSRLWSDAIMATLMIQPPTPRLLSPYLHPVVGEDCGTSQDCAGGEFCNKLGECTQDSTGDPPFDPNPGAACIDSADCGPCDFCNSRGVCVTHSPLPTVCE